jgi:hypothetical protein
VPSSTSVKSGLYGHLAMHDRVLGLAGNHRGHSGMRRQGGDGDLLRGQVALASRSGGKSLPAPYHGRRHGER